MEFNINNPNEFVMQGEEPATLPKGTIGKGGLSAMNDAASGSPTQPKLLGGLQGEKGQAELEAMLFPRIRGMEQINDARGARRAKLAELQAALTSPDNDMDGFDHILRGMLNNPDPSNVGTGFRQGAALAMEERMKRGASKKKGQIDSAKVGLDFEIGEGTNDEQLESGAISNLRSLARPFLSNGARGLGAGGRGAGGRGSPFRWVPGHGLVKLPDDPDGTPEVVMPDTKTGQGIRSQGLRMAMQEVESNLHKMTFKSSAEKAEYIEQRANEIAAEIAGGTAPQAAPAAPAVRPSTSAGGPAVPPAAPAPAGKAPAPGKAKSGADMPDWKSPIAGGRYEILKHELDEATKAGRTADIAALNREIGNLPANERPKNYTLETPEERAVKSAFQTGMAKTSVDYYDGLRKSQEQGLQAKNAIGELKQLRFEPGAFAEWKRKGGNLLEALGSNGPLAKAAAQSGDAKKILQQLTNARVSLEKGVQTKDDVERFQREIAQITDPKEGYRYMLKYMEEMANKQIEQFNAADNYRKQNGHLDGFEQTWQQRNQQMGGLVKRYQGAMVSRSEFINAMMKANAAGYKGKEAQLRADVEKAWAQLGGGK